LPVNKQHITFMSDTDLHAEIEALRREIAAMRAEQAAAKNGEAKVEAAIESGTASLTDQLRCLASEIFNFSEETEKGIVNHLLTSVLSAPFSVS
jgi:outer membrane murein-binding lipoprotein Lpp